MNDETIKILEFLQDNGYVDKNLPLKSLELRLDVDSLPNIKVEYEVINPPYYVKAK